MLNHNLNSVEKAAIYSVLLKWNAYNSSRMCLLEDLIQNLQTDREANAIPQSVADVLTRNYRAEYSKRTENMQKLEKVKEFHRWREDRKHLSDTNNDANNVTDLIDFEEEMILALIRLSEESEA